MKKIAIILAVTLSLGGCAGLSNVISKVETAVTLGTASVANPITKTRLNQMESAVIVVFAGLNGWRTTCIQGLIPPSCKADIAAVQVYTVKIPPYLTQLRVFVKTNDQVNATAIWNQIIAIISQVQSDAAKNGVTISTGKVG